MTTRTAEQRRLDARVAHNRDLDGCPGHAVLSILAERWTTLVLEALADEQRRHAEIARAVPGATQRMLTRTLRRLERDGMVTRTVTAQVPVRVDYALTGLGTELLALQQSVLRFGQRRIDDIRDARRDYDGRA